MSRYIDGKHIPVWVGLVPCLLLGFVFTCIGTGIEPVEREEMNAVVIRLDRCVVVAGDFDRISLFDEDGNRYEIHAANGDQDLAQKLQALPVGTELELLLHPEEDYVLGIYEDGTPILGWQAAQQEIEDEDRGFSWMGYGMWILGIVIFVTEKFSKKKK